MGFYNNYPAQESERLNMDFVLQQAKNASDKADRIPEMIQEYLDTHPDAAQDLYVNVTAPPPGFLPLVGDGIVDNTDNLQLLIQHAAAHNLVLFFPAGVYATHSQIITCTMIGTGKDSELLLLNDRSRAPGFTLYSAASLYNLSIDANREGQSNNRYAVHCTGEQELSEVYIRRAVEALLIEGDNVHYTVHLIDCQMAGEIQGNGCTGTVTGGEMEISGASNELSSQSLQHYGTGSIGYKDPTPINRFFNSIPMHTQQGESYNVLVQADDTEQLTSNRVLGQDVTFSRHFHWLSDDISPNSMQGFTMDGKNYYVFYRSIDDQQQLLLVIDRQTGAQTQHQYGNLGHANNATNDAQYIYVPGDQDPNKPDVVRISKKDYTTKSYRLDRRLTALAIDPVTGIMYGRWGLTYYKVELHQDTSTASTRSLFSVTLDYQYIGQGLAAYNGLLYSVQFEPNALMIIDVASQQVVSVSSIQPRADNILPIGEPEDCEVEDGYIYMASQNSNLNAGPYRLDQVTRFNAIRNQPAKIRIGRSQPFKCYVDSNSSGYTNDGSQDHPMPTLWEALELASGYFAYAGIITNIYVKQRDKSYGRIYVAGPGCRSITVWPGDSYYIVDYAEFVNTNCVMDHVTFNGTNVGRVPCVRALRSLLTLDAFGFLFNQAIADDESGKYLVNSEGGSLITFSSLRESSTYGGKLFTVANHNHCAFGRTTTGNINCYPSIPCISGGGTGRYTAGLLLVKDYKAVTTSAIDLPLYGNNKTTMANLSSQASFLFATAKNDDGLYAYIATPIETEKATVAWSGIGASSSFGVVLYPDHVNVTVTELSKHPVINISII